MSVRVWRTGEPREPAFEAAWNATLARAPYAHYALRLDWLEWNATHGTPGIAVLVEENGIAGVIAARLERGVWVSGLPWRWQAAVASEGRTPSRHIDAPEAERLFAALAGAAGRDRVRAYLPVPPARGIPGFLAGKTILHRIDASDEELQRAMDKTKRSMIRRARRDGYEVVEGTTLDLMRRFAAVQRETDARHGVAPLDGPGEIPPPGLRWREWELPWMWLLVAVRSGEVGSGFGFALGSGSVLESRAAASTRDALRSGAFVLLAFEAARRARENGYRWLNWGGDTFFKRDVSGALGERVPIHLWLGGSGPWALANRAEAVLFGARRFVAGLRRGGQDSAAMHEGEPAPPRAARPASRTEPSVSRDARHGVPAAIAGSLPDLTAGGLSAWAR